MEKVFEARDNLYLGMQQWLGNCGVGWIQIRDALKTLVDVGGYSEKNLLDELAECGDELDYSWEDTTELQSNVNNWIDTNYK